MSRGPNDEEKQGNTMTIIIIFKGEKEGKSAKYKVN